MKSVNKCQSLKAGMPIKSRSIRARSLGHMVIEQAENPDTF